MTEPTEQPGGGARWRGHTHQELYQLLHEGPGAAASAEPSRRWAELAASLSEIGQDLGKSLEQAGAQWTGQAAGRAYDRLATTATWATETSTSAATMRTAVEDQGEHVAKARADMPPPEDVPTTEPDPAVAPAVQIAGAQTDLEGQEAAAVAAEERAFEVMAAYELNTNTTTAALATFAAPPELLPRQEMHHGGGIEHHETRPAAIVDRPAHPQHHDRRPPWHWSGQTGGSSAPWVDQTPARTVAPPTTAAPASSGGFGGLPMTPLRRRTDDEERPRTSNRSGGSVGVANPGNTSTPAPRSVPTTVNLPHDLQAAAASQAAAAAHQAGAPIAPTAGGPLNGQPEKLAMRRFGVEAIGSSQWFADTEEPVVGESPRRRRDFRETGEVTESVSVLGEEHKLPPTVIGEGHAAR